MPIIVEPLQRKTLTEVLDPLNLTLVAREQPNEMWVAFIIDSVGREFNLEEHLEDFGSEYSVQDLMGEVASSLSDREVRLGETVIDCKYILVTPGHWQ